MSQLFQKYGICNLRKIHVQQSSVMGVLVVTCTKPALTAIKSQLVCA